MKEVNFKDRVPTNPGRVILMPVAGKPNTYDMQRADAPIEEGTPIDKATFNSIIHSRLTGRYYDVTVSAIETENTQRFEGETVPKYINVIGSEEMPQNWTKGQRLTLQMPLLASYVVESNNVLGIECNTILQSGKRYELIYNGHSFDAKEM